MSDVMHADETPFHESLRGFSSAIRSGAIKFPEDAEMVAQKLDDARAELTRLMHGVAALPQIQAEAVTAERERCIQAARAAAEKFKANGAPDHAVGALDVISHIVR